MRRALLAFSLPFLALYLGSGCRDREQESSSNQSTNQQSDILSDADLDTAHTVPRDSVDDNGKPLPPLPIEEMTREQLTEYKKVLAEKGFYICCIEPTCRMCLFEFEECPCQHNLKKDEGVCGECFDGWRAGKGNVRGVQSKDVKRID